MKYLTLVLFLGCATTSTLGNVAGTCGDAAVHAAALNLVPDVTTALATDSYVAGLENLVLQAGEAAVDCAVQAVIGQAGTDVARADDPLQAVRVAHGKAWLASRGK